MKKISQVLTEALALIDTPDKWTQESYAKSANNLVVNVHGPFAVCFCSLGAVHRTLGLTDIETAPTLISCVAYLKQAIGGIHVDTFNDTHTHPEVVDMFKKATALAKKDENDN